MNSYNVIEIKYRFLFYIQDIHNFDQLANLFISDTKFFSNAPGHFSRYIQND